MKRTLTLLTALLLAPLATSRAAGNADQAWGGENYMKLDAIHGLFPRKLENDMIPRP